MELDGSTFLLEIANFLVLAWILKRFLFRPVMRVIGERQSALDAIVERTRDKEHSADERAQDYGRRLEQWEKEKEALRIALRDELHAERERRLAQINTEMQEERARLRILDEKAARETAVRTETLAVAQAATFLSRLLRRLAGAALEAKLIDLAIEDLGALSSQQRSEIGRALIEGGGAVEVASAYELTQAARSSIETALSGFGVRTPKFAYTQEPELVAGVRASIGPWTLRANLADELQAFQDAAGIVR